MDFHEPDPAALGCPFRKPRHGAGMIMVEDPPEGKDQRIFPIGPSAAGMYSMAWKRLRPRVKRSLWRKRARVVGVRTGPLSHPFDAFIGDSRHSWA